MFKDSKIRWLVTAVAVAAVAVVVVAPAGAWQVVDGARSDGAQGSLPPQEVQKSILSNSVHEGVQADRRLGTASTAVVTTTSDEYIPGVTDSSVGVMEQVRQNARDSVVTDKAAPVSDGPATTIPYLSQGEGVPASFGETYVPGVTDTGTGINRDLGIESPTVVATEVSDDSFFNWNDDLVIALSAALATALLMALGGFALVNQRRRRMVL